MTPPLVAPRPALPRVLVVDDEPLVGRAVGRVLAGQTEVTTVTSGAAALELLRDPGNDFRLVLCHLMMPDMTGVELRAVLLGVRPDLADRLVFITGGTYTPEMERFLAESACPHLLKPFDVTALRGFVAARL